MTQAEQEMSFFRAASYAQVMDSKVKSNYEESLIKQRNGE